MSEPIQSISNGNYILQGTVATSAGIVGDGSTQNPLRADETVLFTSDTAVSSADLSESPFNFESIKIIIGENAIGYGLAEMTFKLLSTTADLVTGFFTGKANANLIIVRFGITSTNLSSISVAGLVTNFTNGTSVSVIHNSDFLTCIYKVIGINRKAQ